MACVFGEMRTLKTSERWRGWAQKSSWTIIFLLSWKRRTAPVGSRLAAELLVARRLFTIGERRCHQPICDPTIGYISRSCRHRRNPWLSPRTAAWGSVWYWFLSFCVLLFTGPHVFWHDLAGFFANNKNNDLTLWSRCFSLRMCDSGRGLGWWAGARSATQRLGGDALDSLELSRVVSDSSGTKKCEWNKHFHAELALAASWLLCRNGVLVDQ